MDMNSRLPPDLAAAVGEFIVTWSAAQNIVLFAVSDLMMGKPLDEDDDLTVTAPLFGMDRGTHLELLKSLATARLPPDAATRIKKLAGRMAILRDHRNDLAHGLWEEEPKRGQWVVLLTKTVGKVSYLRKPMSAKQVDQWRRALYAQVNRLVQEMQRGGYMQDYSPKSAHGTIVSPPPSFWRRQH